MPRGRYTGGGGRASEGGTGSALMAVDRILSRDAPFRAGVKLNHTLTGVFADRLMLDGDIERCMLQACANDEDKQDELHNFLTEQRDRLKKLSESNVQSKRSIDDFMDAIRAVREQVITEAQKENNNDELPDYERAVRDKMEECRRAKAGTQLDVADEEFCRDICKRLGEKEASKKKSSKRGRNVDDDDDDDLEVIRQPEGTQSLKCPITGMLYDHPVKNKVCGHVYSRAGIDQVLRKAGSKRCPVPGCANQNVSATQLEDDLEMSMKVKRQQKRQERERKQRQSQLADEDSEEEVL